MQITMTGEYAIRAMIHLASLSEGKPAQIAEISQAWDIPESFLRKIITQLAKANLIASQRGIGGGVQLARPATSLTILDILHAVEGPMFLNKCLINAAFCDRTSWCAVHEVWHDAQEELKKSLISKTLADLAARNTEKRLAQRQSPYVDLVLPAQVPS